MPASDWLVTVILTSYWLVISASDLLMPVRLTSHWSAGVREAVGQSVSTSSSGVSYHDQIKRQVSES